MSRIGKRPVVVPRGIKVETNGSVVKVSAKGKALEQAIPAGFVVEVKGEGLS